jgi:ubiquinone/menaquinone biosynthesis C-methylase UbiE
MDHEKAIDYLRNFQYASSENLKTRIELHKRFSTNQYSWFEWIFDHFPQLPTASILEIGCGPGDLWLENLERIPTSWNVTLSDFSAGMVLEAQKKLSYQGKNISFARIDAQDIPFLQHSFDFVVANHMLYHVSNRLKALNEIFRILKPSGVLFAATNGSEHMKELFQIGSWLIPQFESKMLERFSYQGFTLENGSEQLRKVFQNVSMDYFENSLEVTEAKPIVEYILSIADIKDFSIKPDDLQKFYLALERTIQDQGKIFIGKSTGLFTAERA